METGIPGPLESVRLSPDVLVVGSPSGFRVYRPRPGSLDGLFGEGPSGAGGEAVTRQLLAGALHAGWAAAGAGEEAEGDPLLRYVHGVVALAHTTRATSPSMRRVAARFAAEGRPEVAARCLRVAEEEQGHDRLAVEDLDALGIRGEELVARFCPEWAAGLVALLRRFAEGARPIACFGYAWALERNSLFQTAEFVDGIERILPPGVHATRCLRIHSAVGADATHLGESTAFIASLSPEDRASVLRAVYETAPLTLAGRWEYPGDRAMRELLDEHRR